MRGFSNYPFRKEWQIVNVADLEAKYKAGEKVDAVSLLLKGLVKKPEGLIKVLGKGSISIALEVSVDAVSAGAKTKIEAAGGKVETPVAVASAGKA
jgi:large subunit ribosomal protein L15